MFELLLELLAVLGAIPFVLGQIKIDELFFDLVVKGGPGANQQIGRFTGQLKGVGAGADAGAAGLKRFGGASAGASAASGGLTKVLTRMIALFGGILIVRKVTAAMFGFQTTMAEVATISAGGAEQIDALTRATLTLSRSVPQSAEELGAGAYQILSSGVKDTADVISILEASTIAATAGLTDTETAVDAITTVINSFQLQAGEAARVADVLFQTVEDGKLRFEEIAATIGTAATSAALAGVEFEELSAGMAVLTQRGFDAAVSTTALNRLFLTATDKSSEQEAAFEKLGIEFTTTAIKADGFAVVLNRVKEATGGDIDALAELFTEQRAARAAFILAGTGADDFADALDRARNSTGAAVRAFEIMNATAVNQGRILRNNVIATFQEIGISVLPAVATAFGKISVAVNNFVGGIKLLGADAAVVFGQIEALSKSVIASIIEFVEGAFEPIGAILESIADLGEKAARGLRSIAAITPGAEELAIALETSATVLRTAASEENEFAEAARAAADAAALQVGFLKEARTEIEAQIIAEQEFTSTRSQRIAQEAELQAAAARTRQLTEEELEARRDLTAEVLDQVAELTLSAAEQQAREFEKLEKRVAEIFGDEIPRDVRDGLDQIRAIVEEAQLEAAAEELGRQIAEGIITGLEDIELSTLAIADIEERRAEINQRTIVFLEQQKAAIEAQLKAVQGNAIQERAVRRELLAITKLLEKAKDDQEDITDSVRKEAQERSNALTATLSLIQQAINGATDLANEFGLVDDELASVIDNMVQLGVGVTSVIQSVRDLQAGIGNLTSLLAGGIGAAGALASILGGLFAGGPSPAQEARETRLRENTEKLEELKESVERLRGTFDLSGGQVARALQQLGPLEDSIRDFAADIEQLEGGPLEQAIPELIEQFTERLRLLGVDIGNLDAVAEEFGITLRDEAGNIIPSALLILIDSLQAVEGSLVGFAQSIEGVFSRLQAEFEIFDVEDPIEKFQRLQAALLDIAELDPEEIARIVGDETLSFIERAEKLGLALRQAGLNVTPFLAELLAIDVGTPEGREAADKLIRDLFTQLSEGTLTPEELGAATFDEAVQILLEMEGLLDEIAEQEEETGADIEGETQDIRRTVQLTELQGNQLLAFLSTLVVRAEQRDNLLRQIRDLIAGAELGDIVPEPPPVPDDFLEERLRIFPQEPTDGDGIREELAGLRDAFDGDRIAGEPMIETVNIEALITLGEGATPEMAEEAKEILIDNIAEELGDRLLEAQRLAGLRPIGRERIED